MTSVDATAVASLVPICIMLLERDVEIGAAKAERADAGAARRAGRASQGCASVDR